MGFVMILFKYPERAPTAGEIENSLSFKTTMRSFFDCPAWFSASNAIPPASEASPITTTTFFFSFFRSLARARPSPTEIDVELWPHVTVS